MTKILYFALQSKCLYPALLKFITPQQYLRIPGSPDVQMQKFLQGKKKNPINSLNKYVQEMVLTLEINGHR